jgi:hypothetical protein
MCQEHKIFDDDTNTFLIAAISARSRSETRTHGTFPRKDSCKQERAHV